MPNIIRPRNFEKEYNLNGDIILPVDNSTYGTVSKQINLYQIKEFSLSGITDVSSSGKNGTSGMNGIIGIDGENGTSGLLPSSGLTHEVNILDYCGDCNSDIVGTFRHRIKQNLPYLEICMQTGSNEYSWINCIPTTTTTTTIPPTTTTTTTTYNPLTLISIQQSGGTADLMTIFNSGNTTIGTLAYQYSIDNGVTYTGLLDYGSGVSPRNIGSQIIFPRTGLTFKIYDVTSSRLSNSAFYDNKETLILNSIINSSGSLILGFNDGGQSISAMDIYYRLSSTGGAWIYVKNISGGLSSPINIGLKTEYPLTAIQIITMDYPGYRYSSMISIINV